MPRMQIRPNMVHALLMWAGIVGAVVWAGSLAVFNVLGQSTPTWAMGLLPVAVVLLVGASLSRGRVRPRRRQTAARGLDEVQGIYLGRPAPERLTPDLATPAVPTLIHETPPRGDA